MKKYETYKDCGIEWLGKIPEHWKVVPLKFNLSLKARVGWKGLKSDEFEKDSYAYLVTGQDFNGEEINWSNCYQIGKERYEEDSYIQLKNGDLLITKDGTIGKVAKVKNLSKPACLNSGIFVVRQINNNYSQDFLYWLFMSNLLSEYNKSLSTGSTIQHLYQNVFENMPLQVPPISEQERIVSYLDNTIGLVESLISAKERQVEDLQQYRSSVISEAVTRGLHPEVEFRDSGIEWIGKIPFYWDTYKLKYLVNLQSGTNLTAEQIQEDGLYPVYGGNGLRGYYNEFSNDGLFILIGRQGALCGNINYANGKFWATQHAVVCYPKKDFVTKWLGELLRAMNLNQYSESAAQPGLSVERIKQLVIPVPPISEQQEIADYLDNMTSKIDATIQELKTQIEDLRQYKKSVISEAVTGKVDLRDWKPK